MRKYQVGFELELKEQLSVVIEADALANAARTVSDGTHLVIKDLFGEVEKTDPTPPLRCRVVFAREVEATEQPKPTPTTFTVYCRLSDGTYGHSVARSAEGKDAAASMVSDELAMNNPDAEILGVVEAD